MPTLIRSERQTLRAIQDHLLAQKRRAGAAYTQISTIGVIFHPESDYAYLNLVTPHQGVAWTRGEDLRQGFQLLESRGRLARLQYLRGLFPEAFARQLTLYGLQLELELPVWVYSPIQGPFPADERPFGRIAEFDGATMPLRIHEVNSVQEMAVWLRVYRSALYNVDVTVVDTADIESAEAEQANGESLYILGYYHGTPIAALRIIYAPLAAEIVEPAIIWPWTGLGFEEALMTYAVHLLQYQNHDVIFSVGNPDLNLYWRLGFVQLTQIVTYLRTRKSSL